MREMLCDISRHHICVLERAHVICVLTQHTAEYKPRTDYTRAPNGPCRNGAVNVFFLFLLAPEQISETVSYIYMVGFYFMRAKVIDLWRGYPEKTIFYIGCAHIVSRYTFYTDHLNGSRIVITCIKNAIMSFFKYISILYLICGWYIGKIGI